jgi:hypothetical protein
MLIILSGCSAERNLIGAIADPQKGSQYAVQVEQVRNFYEKEYLGKTKDYLLNKLGEPRLIDKNAWIHGKKHDESWYYNFSRGYFKEANSEPAKAVWFYISNDIVQAIKVF